MAQSEIPVKPYEGSEPFAFISYSHQDTKRIAPVLEKLSDQGCRIWYDNGISGGSIFTAEIQTHLKASQVCIAFVSPSSLQSQYCTMEIKYAIMYKIPILPILIDRVDIAGNDAYGVEMLLSSYEFLYLDQKFGEPKLMETLLSNKSIQRCIQNGENRPDISQENEAKGDTNHKEKTSYRGKKPWAIGVAAAVVVVLLGVIIWRAVGPADSSSGPPTLETMEQTAGAAETGHVSQTEEPTTGGEEGAPVDPGGTSEETPVPSAQESTQDTPQGEPSGQEIPLTPSEIIELDGPAVVIVNSYDAQGSRTSYGSGFFVDDQGTMVTCYHLIKDAYKVTAQLTGGDGNTSTVQVVGIYNYNEELDLAVLRADVKGNEYLLFSGEGTGVGATAYILGNLHGNSITFSGGTDIVRSKESDQIFISAKLNDGGGGPLVNEAAEVIGVYTNQQDQQEEDLRVCISADAVQTLLASNDEMSWHSFRKNPADAAAGEAQATPADSGDSSEAIQEKLVDITQMGYYPYADLAEEELNNTLDTAKSLQLNQLLAANLSDTNDIDCYYIEAPEGCTIELEWLLFDLANETDLKLELLQEDGAVLQSVSAAADQTLQLIMGTERKLYLRVFHSSNGTDAPIAFYALQPSVTTITFGHYEQDNDLSNGAEPIQWRVLAVENGRALLISEYGLDSKLYNDAYTDVTWETCALRQWLNGEFYTTAFDAGERSAIAKTTVTAEDNSNFGTIAGNDTIDRIFLLSTGEVESYFANDNDLLCVPTTYAYEQGCWYTTEYKPEGTCWWWLRSPGIASGFAAGVYNYGGIDYEGNKFNFPNVGVRPAMWIDLGA